jgi:hypothetical protein
MATLHQQRTHPVPVPGCDACRWSSILLGNWATSQAGEREIIRNLMAEAEINGYRDARRQGLQPRGTRWPDIQEALTKSRYRDEPFSAATAPLDPGKDWGDGAGDLELAPAPLEGRAPETVEVVR